MTETLNETIIKRHHSPEEEECLQSKRTEGETFLKFKNLDMDNLASIFNAFSTKKTYATGFFNLALIATNISQVKKLFMSQQDRSGFPSNIALGTHKISWNIIDSILIAFISVSLLLQLLVGVLLIFLARRAHHDFLSEETREDLIKNNNSITCLVLAISIINVFINVFLNV